MTTKPFNTRAVNARDDYPTPDWIYDRLDETYQFNVDLAANADNTKCAAWLGPGSIIGEDALAADWQHLNAPGLTYRFPLRGFMNPPFSIDGRSVIADFLHKAYEETRAKGLVVALLPARTDASWFHDFVIAKASHYHLLRGRIQFDPDGKSGNNFGSVVAVYEPGLERDRPGRKMKASE